jgi:very-short-patch-repair endonuclease
MPRFVYTKPELILYEKLKKEKINFSTQIPILIKKYKKYVYVDFLIEKKLVVEVDGIKHRKSKIRIKKDIIKDKALRAKGYSILRIPDYEILNNVDDCFNKIIDKLIRIKRRFNC